MLSGFFCAISQLPIVIYYYVESFFNCLAVCSVRARTPIFKSVNGKQAFQCLFTASVADTDMI